MVYINTNKHYAHWNRAMGKYIKNKSHYLEEMKKGGYVFQEHADEMADRYHEDKAGYKPTRFVKDIFDSCQVDKKTGKAKMPDKAIKALEEKGMSFDMDKINKANEAIAKGWCL